MPWTFALDRGGTFTDIVARDPQGQLVIHKLLSESHSYEDAVVQGIRDILGLSAGEPVPAQQIEVVNLGTTIATNALLERKGDRTVLLITKGFRDALRIGYQNRPDIFAQKIILPEMLYEQVIEVEERYSVQGEELVPLNPQICESLQQAYALGIKSCAVVLMHGWRYTKHEEQLGVMAQEIGFSHVSLSHQVSPVMKLISRGDTTVVDAYLSPILHRYIDQVSSQLGGAKVMLMQSNGGLVEASHVKAKDSILSGPAGGIVGAVQTSTIAGFDKIISFDMGGTSTDVAHYTGEYERAFETEVAGVRLRAPMMDIHTVAAGGGSLVSFEGSRYRVGPESAGANPGPACYRLGGPLTVTDCNVMLRKLQPGFFPQVFGPNSNESLDAAVVQQKFEDLAQQIQVATGDTRTPEEVAAGFLAIAIENMANAIKKISLQRGYDVSEYTLCCFGGAGGQHACLIADALDMRQVFIHPHASVLSAYGIGLADVRLIRERAIEAEVREETVIHLQSNLAALSRELREELVRQNAPNLERVEVLRRVHLRYQGSNSTLVVDFAEDARLLTRQFEGLHKQRYGFIQPDKQLIAETVSVEIVGKTKVPDEPEIDFRQSGGPEPVTTVEIYTAAQWHNTPIFRRDSLQAGDSIIGPALIVEPNSTNVIEPGWQAHLTKRKYLILKRVKPLRDREPIGTALDPVRLEMFHNRFRFIAEQMGVVLQQSAFSVNIKERLDFSCAIFDQDGQLVANAPHIPVHLGAMSETVQALITEWRDKFQPGDVYASNNPFKGGSHLPDITVITPVFDDAAQQILFYVASRGHHADIGGITPGSMPPHSKTVEQEGVLIDNIKVVSQGSFQEKELQELLSLGTYPARNPVQNVADLRAQIAANKCGVQELRKMVEQYGLETVQAYMGHVQDNAEEAVRRAINNLQEGYCEYALDNGGIIKVDIKIDQATRSARIDFSGTSPQQLDNNFNTPKAVCKAAVLYVFRTLVEDDIPLNAGCLKPLEIIIPEGSMLDPHSPAAVVAGNVETSQVICDALYRALGVMAASQGTMNNFTFGNRKYQYYETIAGGSGAGPDFDGADAVQCHMTNSRITDPEVLEWRFPVLLQSFSIRPHSGGKGRFHGGNGVIRRLGFLEPMTANILSGRRTTAPRGIAGGDSGLLGKNLVERRDGNIEQLGSTAEVQMQPGDVFVIETPGGGGYGESDSSNSPGVKFND
ncbi:hydantoinase B/oxoprolinase family protein [Lyngbya aestuarii]|uniref:hydantoinase B/oxoprolinase family protein n=1 Tax=Lyngbya aestuarii TaxID=118322 RepID=UPI00403D6775